jgi:hypothetical protein
MTHQQAQGKYGDNEEGIMNFLPPSLLIGLEVQTIERPL